MSGWKTLSSREAYKNKWIRIREDQVIQPNGNEGIYGVLELGHDVVYVVPIWEDGSVELVSQFRYPIQKQTLEFAAGQADEDNPEVAARRELLEETGLTAKNLDEVAVLAVDTGFCATYVHIFVATGLTKETDELDADDGISNTVKVSRDTMEQMITDGEIICPHTIAAFYLTTKKASL